MSLPMSMSLRIAIFLFLFFLASWEVVWEKLSLEKRDAKIALNEFPQKNVGGKNKKKKNILFGGFQLTLSRERRRVGKRCGSGVWN